MSATDKARIRIDGLTPGSYVELEFNAGREGKEYYEPAIFLGIEGEGDARRAHFLQAVNNPRDVQPAMRPHAWDVYRYNRRWSFGSSADPIRVNRVLLEV